MNHALGIWLDLDIVARRRKLIEMHMGVGGVKNVIFPYTDKGIFTFLDFGVTQDLFDGRIREGFKAEIADPFVGMVMLTPLDGIIMADGG